MATSCLAKDNKSLYATMRACSAIPEQHGSIGITCSGTSPSKQIARTTQLGQLQEK
jgi:hypothetical protein